MNLDELLAEQRRSGIVLKDAFPKAYFDTSVPSGLICAWKNAVEARARLREELQWAFDLQAEREDIQNDPMKWLGKRITKRSGKPFKGGETVVKAIGIIAHPELPGDFAFEYEYDAGRHVAKSYCRLSTCQLQPGELLK